MASKFVSSARDAIADARPLDRGPLDRPAPSDRHAALQSHAEFAEIARAVVGRGDVREIARLVADAARRLLSADESAVWTLLPERDALRLLAVAPIGDAPPTLPDALLPLDGGELRAALERGRVLRATVLERPTFWLGRLLAAEGPCDGLIAPVVAGGAARGLLVVGSRQAGGYDVEHEVLAEHLAAHLAAGLEQARLTAEARRHQERLLGLQRVAQRLAASVAGEDVTDLLLAEAVRSVGGDAGTLYTWDEARSVLLPLRSTERATRARRAVRPGHGVAGRAIQHSGVIVVHGGQPSPVGHLSGGVGAVCAAIGAPLIADGQLLGAVTANIQDPHKRFDDADAQVFELYAGQAAAVLKAARLFESERRQRRGAEEAARSAAAIVAEMDQQRRLDLLVERAVTIVGGAAGSLALLDPASGALTVRAAYGRPVEAHGADALPVGVGRRVVAERRAVLADPDSLDAPDAGRDAPASGAALGVPVVARGELLGALAIEAASGGPRLTAEDVPLVQTIADLAAIALDNARSLEREKRRRRQIEAVRSVTVELTRELDLTSLLDLILLRASQFVRCEATAVLLWDESSATLVPTAWRGPGDWASTTRLGLGDGAAGAAARLREGVVAEDYRDWPAGDGPAGAAPPSPTSVMAVPLVYKDRLIGVLTANRFGIAESFNRHDLELLDVFGTQAAVAIENARLFEQATIAEALRELAQLKAELLNTVSHELRTPLSLIHGYAELLMHRADRLTPGEIAEMSEEIFTSSRTLARLVDDVLDFSNLDHGRLQLERRRVALAELLAGPVRTYRAHPGGERIQAEIAPGLAVDADPDRLKQIVGNLLANALAYTTSGPIVVRARRAGDAVRVEVADEGPGLAPEEVGRVWESLYRGLEATNLPNRGTGLGLTVVKHLVELHGGQVGVESKPGQGATFWFTLPAS